MLAGFPFGLVVIATLAGSLGAFLLEVQRERAAGTGPEDVEGSARERR